MYIKKERRAKAIQAIGKNFASGSIENFLNFLREVENLYRQAELTEQETSDQTQDLLHMLELADLEGCELIHSATQLREIRQQRRTAKDTMYMLSVTKDWVENNTKTIKDLEQLLGKARKAEKNTENRIYTFKTDIGQA